MLDENATVPCSRMSGLLGNLQPYPERMLTKVDDALSSVRDCTASAADITGKASTADTLPDWQTLPCCRLSACWNEDGVPEFAKGPAGGCKPNGYDLASVSLMVATLPGLHTWRMVAPSDDTAYCSPYSCRGEECRRCDSPVLKDYPVHVIGSASTDDSPCSGEAYRTEESLSEQSVEHSVTQGVMESIREDAQMQAWRPEQYTFIRTLEQAARNEGVVELMEETTGKGFVAVKRMPLSWTARGHDEFLREHQGETENPWVDVGMVKYLNQIGYPYVCKLLGTFQDGSETRIAYSFANRGDLFSWVSSSSLPEQGIERERLLRPIVKEVLVAVSSLHRLDIAHCDISLENILLTSDPSDRALQVKLIDFSMATVGSDVLVGKRGKTMYHAPEVHLDVLCSPFPYDVFALGLVILLVATEEYPWVSTRSPGCKKFQYAQKYGLFELLKKLKLRSSRKPVFDVMSHSLTELVGMMLAFDPACRCTLRSLPEAEWLNGESLTTCVV
eukprot:TRINITY_DN35636_c0_g1_i1.p1 TRINITY_DN35636_c0_g1~~TRINITY_DN35636_c0_g1_i1.p1  ORF type:complete len:519 (-),score=50.73 TRINITY_DN35636_c0_g1_i1:162-1670(-)